MKIRTLVTATFLTALLFISHAASAQTKLDVKKLDKLFDVLESSNRMMGSVTLTKKGKIIYQRSLGYRNILDKANVRTNAETEFRIGSITKVYTAVLVWQLIEAKKLTLETKVAKFFPQIPNSDSISIANLLSHTSGLHDYTDGVSYEPADATAWIFRSQTPTQMIARIAALKPDFLPGERYQYSNTNYTLLGYVIEAVTGSTYGEQLNKRIVRRLKLHRTRYGASHDSVRNEAYSFVFDNGKWNRSPGQELSAAGGAGGIVSTTNEIARFINALANDELINRRSRSRMTKPYIAKFPESHLGIASFKLRGIDKIAISKQGGIDAFTSDIVYVPEDKFAFALTINGHNYPMSKIFWNVMDIYYQRPVDIPSFKPLQLSPDALRQFKGQFGLKGTGITIEIKPEAAGLSGRATGQDSFALEAIGDLNFINEPSGIIIEFRKTADGRIQAFTLYQGRNVSVWEKPE